MRRVPVVLFLLMVAVAAPIRAQQASPPPTAPLRDTLGSRTGSMIGTGAGLGVAGFIAGVGVGGLFDPERVRSRDCTGSCTRWGAAAGAFAGVTAGTALGVHLANFTRGRFAKVVLYSAAAGTVMFGGSYLTRHTEGLDMLFALLTFPAEIAASIHAEKATTPHPIPPPPPPSAASTAP